MQSPISKRYWYSLVLTGRTISVFDLIIPSYRLMRRRRKPAELTLRDRQGLVGGGCTNCRPARRAANREDLVCCLVVACPIQLT